jgi:hypothetical protein
VTRRLLLAGLAAAGLAAAQAPEQPLVLGVLRHADIIEFERPAEPSLGLYLGLSLDGIASVEVRALQDDRLVGTASPASVGEVLFVIWSAPLPGFVMRTATAVVAGSSLRVAVPRATGSQISLIGPEQGWDIAAPAKVAARVFVDGTTGLTYLLVSAEGGTSPCARLALLYDVSAELRLVGRSDSCVR